MLKIITKRFSALALSAAVLFAAVPSGFGAVSALENNQAETDSYSVETSDPKKSWEDKVSSELLEKMKAADDNEKFYVQLDFGYPVSEDEMEKEIYNRTGLTRNSLYNVSSEEYEKELANWTEEDEKSIEGTSFYNDSKTIKVRNRVINRKEEIYFKARSEVRKEIFIEYNEKCFNELGLNATEEDIDYKFETEPLYDVFLNKADIIKAAENDNVKYIYYFSDSDVAADSSVSDPKSKMSDKVIEEIEKNPNGKVSVRIALSDSVNISGSASLQATLELINIAKSLNIERYKPMCMYDMGDYVPINVATIYVELPVNEIYRVASQSNVEGIFFWTTDPEFVPAADNGFSYTSEDALRILRSSVGLEEKDWTVYSDVNQDGKLDSSDALIALRVSVKLEDVHYNITRKYPLYDVSKYGVSEYFY